MRFREVFPRVVQFGPPRTGSTLVWNAMRVMLPGEVIPKRHDLNPLLRCAWYPCRIVCTVRNPLDAIASSIRRYALVPTADVVGEQINEFKQNGMDELPQLLQRKNVLVLEYEAFYQDFGFLFDQLEAFFDASADAGLREKFHAEFSAWRVKEKSDRLGAFENFSVEDHIHGGHVSERLGKPGGHVEMFAADAERRIREAFAWHFETFGY